MEVSSMQSLISLIANYMEMAEFIKKLSPNTIKAYQIDLKQFAAFTQNTLADGDTIKRYIMHLNQRFAPRSVKRKIASVRAFYRELSISGILKKIRLISYMLVYTHPNNFPVQFLGKRYTLFYRVPMTNINQEIVLFCEIL